MKLGPVSKLDKRDKMTSKKIVMTSCQLIFTSLLFFLFMADLEQCGSQILNA